VSAAAYVVSLRRSSGRSAPANVCAAAASLARSAALFEKPDTAFERAGGGFLGIAGGVAEFNTEAYDHIEENRFHRVDADPLSTFSVDVDTASYANVRRFLVDGALPPAGAVRTEELINYFRFTYPQPSDHKPFSITTELSACPWNPTHRQIAQRCPLLQVYPTG